jgi:glycosyltransferase involved in cell wall biosynthesis/peptidoglycan/xylan/chitin deacetylase (PgdA/CDA1 family)
MYHKIGLESPTMWWVTVNNFYRQMVELASKKVVYLDDYDPNDNEQVVITFDGVYQNVLKYAAPIMHKFGYPFELFITRDYLGKDNEFDSVEPNAVFATTEELKQMELLGGRMQWHTKSHPDLKTVTDAGIIEKELTVPADLKIFDKDSFGWFAYPYGNFNSDVVNAAKKYFKGAVSCNQGSDSDLYTLNRITVTNENRFTDETISCIITSYNYGDFLTEAIESVLRQTIPPDEIIIADDGSTDMTGEVAAYYQQKNPKLIKYFRNKTNLGIVKNFNKAIASSTGSFIVFLGADNRFQSNYFEECAGILNRDKSIGIVYTDYLLFDTRAKTIYNGFEPEYKGEVKNRFYRIVFPSSEDVDLAEALKKQNVIHGSSMYRREAFEKVGGYKQTEEAPEDYNLFARMLKAGYGAKKAKATVLQYRQHSLDQANHRFGSNLQVNFYMRKSKEMEAELNFLKRYKIVSLISFGFSMKNNAGRLLFYLKKNGIKKTLGRLMR